MINQARFNTQDLLRCFGDSAAHLPADLEVVGISTDTRTLVPGNAFIALRGKRFDGHDHVAAAFSKGAALCIVEDAALIQHDVSSPYLNGTAKPPSLVLQQPSTLHALGVLGWYHRRRFEIPIVAIAGSAGKTSTKELVAHVLGQRYTILQTPANYNNRIGTPLTILQLGPSHTAAVIEIGTNEPGEIEILAAMVQPTHGLITQIGKEHLEKLIDLDGVEREETTLFEYLKDHDGVMLVNADDARLRLWYATHGGRGLSFGVEQKCDLQVQLTFDDHLHPILHVVSEHGGMRAVLASTGYACGLNGVAAYAVAVVLGLDALDIKRGLESYTPPPVHGYARMAIQNIGIFTVLNDTYNANPESMRMALRTLGMYTATRRIAVLGDMRELGTAAQEEHKHILALAMEVADVVMLYGPEFGAVAGNPNMVFESHAALAQRLREIGKPGDVVLLKGSRGMEMERVMEERY